MKLRVILSCFSLFFGAFIVWLSLSASVKTSPSDTASATQKLLYFNREVMPDHVFYPVLMAMDKSRLEAAHPVEKIYLQVEYANRRFYYVQELLEHGKTELAHSTLTKAEKYVLQAGLDAQAEGTPQEAKDFVVKALTIHSRETARIKSSFSDAERAVLDQILFEEQQLIEQLQAN